MIAINAVLNIQQRTGKLKVWVSNFPCH